VIENLNPYGPEWRGLRRYLVERKDEHRKALEAPGLPERQADLLRGRIAEINALVATVETPVPDSTPPLGGSSGGYG
jgi:hypothetical protein